MSRLEDVLERLHAQERWATVAAEAFATYDADRVLGRDAWRTAVTELVAQGCPETLIAAVTGLTRGRVSQIVRGRV
jgi:hypothetical protein